jgi:hypothetical protein
MDNVHVTWIVVRGLSTSMDNYPRNVQDPNLNIKYTFIGVCIMDSELLFQINICVFRMQHLSFGVTCFVYIPLPHKKNT